MIEVNKLKSLLSKEFDMKDLGAAKKILGMEIHRDRRVLEWFNMDNAKPVSTPLANHFRLSTNQCPKIDDEVKDMSKVPYASAVGCLMYVIVCTRPNLAHVSVVSKFLSNLGRMHWDVVKWIFRYLKGDLDDRRSTIGYVFTLAKAAKESLWLTGLVKELGIQQGGIQLYCDSQSVIYLEKNQMYHARTKHIDVRFHKITELVSSGELLLKKVHTSENATNMLIKLVTTEKFKHCLNLINVSRC
ncbi:hypothetical protein AAG906_022515 [Vitis piasezkii]